MTQSHGNSGDAADKWKHHHHRYRQLEITDVEPLGEAYARSGRTTMCLPVRFQA